MVDRDRLYGVARQMRDQGNEVPYMSEPFDRLLSFAEAAEIWGLSESTLRKWVERGHLRPGRDCRKFGKQWVVSVDGMRRAMREGYTHWDMWTPYVEECEQLRYNLGEDD